MIWIQCRRDEKFPEELLYYDCYDDKNINDQTPLMLWKQYQHSNKYCPSEYYPIEFVYPTQICKKIKDEMKKRSGKKFLLKDIL